jgi:hypothetical protein
LKILFIIILIFLSVSCNREEKQAKTHLVSTNYALSFLYFDEQFSNSLVDKKLIYNEKNKLSEIVYYDYHILKLNYDINNNIISESFYNANQEKWDTANYILNQSGKPVSILHGYEVDSLVYDENTDLIKKIRYQHPDNRGNSGGYYLIETYEYDDNHNIIDYRYFSRIHSADHDVLYPWDWTFHLSYNYDDHPSPLNLIGVKGNNELIRSVLSTASVDSTVYQYDYDGFPITAKKTRRWFNNQLQREELETLEYYFTYN